MGAVAIYARKSKDDTGSAQGVAAQMRECRQYVEGKFPDSPTVEFSDNDLTAADPDVHRPGYADLLAAVRRGEVSAVVATEQSRLTRQPGEWDELLVTLDRAGIAEVHTTRSGILPVRGSKLIGRIFAAIDAEEVERIKVRVRARMVDLAAQGRPPGGRIYGYARDEVDGIKVMFPDPDEAPVVRWVAAEVLAGRTMADIVASLKERGIPTAQGGEWGHKTIKSILRSPTIAGLRVHKGEVVGEGNWDPILDRDTWQRVRDVLERPVTWRDRQGAVRTAPRRHRAPTRFLLTAGLSVCGVCGAPLRAQMRAERGRAIYRCGVSPGSCVTVRAAEFEGEVVEQVLYRLSTPELAAALVADDWSDERARHRDRLDAVESRRRELAGMFAAGDMNADEWKVAREVIDRDAAQARAAIDALPPPVVGFDPATVADAWDGLDIGQRREVIATVVDVVVLHRADGRGTPAADRTEIRWRA